MAASDFKAGRLQQRAHDTTFLAQYSMFSTVAYALSAIRFAASFSDRGSSFGLTPVPNRLSSFRSVSSALNPAFFHFFHKYQPNSPTASLGSGPSDK